MVFDKAYLDFAHLFDLLQRGVFWVTRAKENMACEVLKALPVAGRILRDEIVGLRTACALARSLSDLAIVLQKSAVFDHRNTFGKNKTSYTPF